MGARGPGEVPQEAIGGADTAAAAGAGAAPRREPRDSVGEIVGNYRLARLIGRGGMGSVYQAEHLHLAKPAAIKFLNPELSANKDIVQRFFHEAVAATRIAHPGIVSIFDFGVQGDGRAYIVMELLAGQSLQEVFSRGPLSVLRAAAIGADLADVLHAAHEVSIVHRDLKPDNIFLIADPDRQGRERVKVLDFGIAKLAGKADGALTRTGAVMGTPLYMSPEQARGSGEVDHRTDIYSLGCVLYEALAGKPVFAAAGFGEIIAAHIHDEPPRLRDRRRGIPAPLDDLIHRMLAKRPAERPATMLEVAEDLRRLVGATPPRGFAAVPGRGAHGSGVGQTQPMFRPGRPVAVARGTSPWAALDAALPPHMRTHAEAVRAFLASVFGGAEPAEPGMVTLTDPLIPFASGQQFFALFVTDEKDQVANPGKLETLDTGRFRTHYLTRLEAFLRTRTDPGTRVVVAIASAGEIGRGVRELILGFRRQNDAIVIPVYIGEILAAHRERNERRLFNDRLHALHTLPDPFAMRGASDPTAFAGMNADLNRLVQHLAGRGGFINVTGQPGSGKSALVRQADYAFQDRQFVYLRCQECSERTPRAFVQDLLASLPPLDGGVAGEPSEIRSRTVAAALAARLPAPAGEAEVRGCPVLVLEDADWLIHSIASASAPEAARAEARAVWSGLAEVARADRLAVVITSVRGFELRQRFADWENPVRPEHIAIAPLKVHDLRLVIDRLGSTIDFHFDDTLEQIHELSGGNVFVARAICSQVVQLYRARPRHHILERVDVSPDFVTQAARELAAVTALFEPAFTSWLSKAERAVLHFVATVQPRKARAVRRDLGRRARTALSALQEMRLVTLRDDRYRLAIPLMEDWVREHIDAADDHDDKRRKRRIRALAIGGTLAAVSLALYFAFRSGWSYSTWTNQADSCTYTIGYPERVAPGEQTVGMTFNRTCRAPQPAARSIVIVGKSVTVPPIDGAILTKVTVPVTATLLGAPEQYEFSLDVDGKEGPPFTIERDRLASFKEGLSSASQMAAIVSLVFGLFFAFFFEVKKGIRRAVDAIRGAEEESPPEATS